MAADYRSIAALFYFETKYSAGCPIRHDSHLARAGFLPQVKPPV